MEPSTLSSSISVVPGGVTAPAGQRPYLAMPETVAPIVPHQGRTIGADGVLGV